ncbi:MAG: divergent polysaccharide deacetylase family protein [Aliidongia sp.]
MRERGLFFLDSRTTPHTVGIDLAQEMGLPHAARDVFLDDDLAAPAVAVELTKTEAVARRNGIAIAIGHPHVGTIAELRRWLPLAEAHGFRLVPVTAIRSTTMKRGPATRRIDGAIRPGGRVRSGRVPAAP